MHVFSTTVLATHLDSFGHMNNASYLMLLEDARWDMITRAGYGPEKIKATGLGPTILEVTLRFKRELILGDSLSIQSVCHQPKRKIMHVDQIILRSGEVCAEARFTMGLFDLNTRKLVAPSADWLQVIEAFPSL
jgi:acyl-CoA thioester hydrolase